MLQAREQALGVGASQGAVSAIEARERSLAVKQVANPAPDWFERLAAAHSITREPVVDDRFRIDPTSNPAPVSAKQGRDIEWPQIGIGLGLGTAFVLVLLALKATRQRPLAH
jgi:hypothetical protein